MTVPASPTTSASTSGSVSVPPVPTEPAHRVRFVDVVVSEWTKLRTVRSTYWTLVSMFVVTVGLGVLVSWGVASTYDDLGPQDRATFDPTAISLVGLTFGQLAVAVLGAMAISTEYSTGGIRTSLTAVPRRLQLLLAKALVFFVVALAAGLVTSFVSFFLGQLLLSSEHVAAGLGDDGVLRAVVGGGLYLAGSGMFGFALGALLRSTAGGITLAVALLLVLPIITATLPGDWGDAVQRYFTSNAGQQITNVRPPEDQLGPWSGYLVFTVWWAAILAVAAGFMQRRDA